MHRLLLTFGRVRMPLFASWVMVVSPSKMCGLAWSERLRRPSVGISLGAGGTKIDQTRSGMSILDHTRVLYVYFRSDLCLYVLKTVTKVLDQSQTATSSRHRLDKTAAARLRSMWCAVTATWLDPRWSLGWSVEQRCRCQARWNDGDNVCIYIYIYIILYIMTYTHVFIYICVCVCLFVVFSINQFTVF